jgi:hypothetical protein
VMFDLAIGRLQECLLYVARVHVQMLPD